MSIELIPEEELWHPELVPEEDIKRRNRTKKIIIGNGNKDGDGDIYDNNGEYSIYSKYARYIVPIKRKKKYVRRKIEIDIKKEVRRKIKRNIKIENSKFRKNIFSIKDWAWAVVGENSEDILREIYDDSEIKKVKMIDVLKLIDDGYLYEKGKFVIQRNYGKELQQEDSIPKTKKPIRSIRVDKCLECACAQRDTIHILGSFWKYEEYFFVINGKQFLCRPRLKGDCDILRKFEIRHQNRYQQYNSKIEQKNIQKNRWKNRWKNRRKNRWKKKRKNKIYTKEKIYERKKEISEWYTIYFR